MDHRLRLLGGDARDHRPAAAPLNVVAARTLKSALEDKARRFPEAPFLWFEDAEGRGEGPWTWRDFDRAVNRAAHFLLTRGLAPGDRFNLHLGNGPEFLVFRLAAVKTGTVMVPTNPASTTEEMAYGLAHSEVRLAITEPRVGEACRAVRDRCPALRDIVDCRPARGAAGPVSRHPAPRPAVAVQGPPMEFRETFPRTSVGKIQKHLF